MAMSFLINTPVNARLVNWLPWSALKISGLPYLARCGYSKLRNVQNSWRFPRTRHTIVGMITYLSALASLLSFRFRSRASLELELLALRHQVTVLRRQRPGRLRLFCADRLLWVWLYRVWPQVLNAMLLVKPATVVQWHRQGFRLYWRWRSRRLGRPKMGPEARDLIRRMSVERSPTHSPWSPRCG